MLIDLIAGARPNFMKVAPIIRALEARWATGGPLRYRLVHTGQHYDARLSGDFFTQLGIPEPDINLEAGSGTQAEQTAAIMVRYERLLLKARTDLCLVVGDVTSTMACAIAAQKLCIPVAHVEGGDMRPLNEITEFFIGVGPAGDRRSYNGLMDDFGVWDTALSESEIRGLAAPEPSSTVLLALGSLGLLGARRRRG